MRIRLHDFSDGTSIDDLTQVYVTWIAMGPREIATQTRHCANTELMSTTGTGSVTITFPVGMFNSAPNMSITGLIISGTNAGRPLYIVDKTTSITML